MNKKTVEIPFEECLSSLVVIVDELEKGQYSLDESVKKFEKGVELYKQCKNILSSAEKKITVLSDSLREEELLD